MFEGHPDFLCTCIKKTIFIGMLDGIFYLLMGESIGGSVVNISTYNKLFF
jgi:hypothetical protein